MICSNKGCENAFEAKTHNQKYCCDECCREATNAKIKQKYYDKKERLAGKKRICKNRGCQTILSRYNQESTCEVCNAAKRGRERQELLSMVLDVSS